MTKLQTVRRSLGISQQRLADSLGLSMHTVGHWERRISAPTRKQALALGEWLLGQKVAQIETDSVILDLYLGGAE
jgi:DNA-binding XRE family transcriptional regulator